MLAVVLAAGLFPNAGTVQAQSSCPYGGCSTSSAVPTWELVSILVLVAAAVIAAALLLMRRRRPPTQGTSMKPWEEPPAGAAGGPGAGAPPGAGGPVAPYIEGPEDVGHPPPTVGTTPAVGAGAGAAAGASAGAASSGEPDIDSLMAELDKISSEILKKPTKKRSGGSPDESDEDVNSPP